MNLGQLRKVLKSAENHYRQDGKAAVADALARFAADVIEGADSATVASFVKSLKEIRTPSKPRDRRKR